MCIHSSQSWKWKQIWQFSNSWPMVLLMPNYHIFQVKESGPGPLDINVVVFFLAIWVTVLDGTQVAGSILQLTNEEHSVWNWSPSPEAWMGFFCKWENLANYHESSWISVNQCPILSAFSAPQLIFLEKNYISYMLPFLSSSYCFNLYLPCTN